MRRFISEKTKKQAISRYLQGDNVAEICWDLKMSRYSLVTWVRQSGGHVKPAATQRIHSSDWDNIVRLIDSGDYTLGKVGAIYGVSRERVRQIYKKVTGRGARFRYQKLSQQSLENAISRLEEVVRHCEACGEPVKRFEGGKSFCLSCRAVVKAHRNPRLTEICEVCGVQYHPNRIYEYKGIKPHTCSVKCGVFRREANRRLKKY